MVRRNYKRSERLRKIRCQSADSGVDTSLNTVFQRAQSSYTDINGLEEEHLDFEPDLGDAELNDNANIHSNYSQSTVEIINSDREGDNDERLENGSVSTISIRSIGHRREMLPVPRIDAKDGRQNEYFPFRYSDCSNVVTLDSSDEGSTSSDYNDIIIKSETEDDLSRSQTLDGSGDLQDSEINDEYSECNEQDSEWNISQEEEDRLLDDTDEEPPESPESCVTIDRTEVDVCRFGNVNITLPVFKRDFYEEESIVKRRKTSQFLDPKRRKWDVRFVPQESPTRLFLKDIGYIPPCNESDSDSSASTAQSRKLYVVCNEKDKMVFEKSPEELHREMPFSKSDDSNFKLPLPPAKRPPTRPKRTVSNTNESTTNLKIQVVNKQTDFGTNIPTSRSGSMSFESNDIDKDDTISLIASTIGDNVEDISAAFSSVEESDMELDESPPRNFNYSKELVENWIQSVPNPEPPESVSTREGAQAVQAPYDGFSMMPPVYPNGSPRTNFKIIPPIFRNLCYYQYFSGKCRAKGCPRMHSINREQFACRFSKATPDELRTGYSFALKYDQLFKEIYPCFLLAFGSLKMHNDLTKSITDLLRIKDINSTDALEIVMQAFVKSGITFPDAIEKISFNVGFLQYPVLADILLELVTRQMDISENWGMIHRIARARGYIPPDIARRILTRLVSGYPLDRKLCLEIYNVIIKDNMTDLAQVGDVALKPFRTMEGFRELGKAPSAPARLPLVQLTRQDRPDDREMLAAHIDKNLVKERERFEREVGSDYRQDTVRECFSQSLDADERYFMPEGSLSRRSPFINRASGSERMSASGSTSSFDGICSPQSSLHFEPPQVNEYVPETIRRIETTPRNYSPAVEPSAKSPPVPQKLNIDLTPPVPIFGKPRYRPDFKFDVSLHYLLPDTLEDVNINERDVGQLNYAIKSKNGAEFFRLSDYYKSPATIRNFITMTLAHLKSCENSLYELLVDLIQALETERPDYTKDLHMKVIVEVVIMNILFELERRGHLDKARKLLERFCDWDSLISSQIFPKRKLTHMGRYIFLAKIFAKGKNYHFTSEILQCPSLHLLETCENWPYACDPQVDMKSRNIVLSDFFQDGYYYNIVDVSDMFRRVYKYNGIYGYDARTHFNPMLIKIMNANQVSLLKPFQADIDMYSKEMDKNVLRAFTVLLSDQLDDVHLFKLYDICCDRQIYTYYSGCETSIILRTNMLDQEVRLILGYYLERISKSGRLPIGDMRVVIKLFEVKVLYPKVLQKCVRSIQEINEKVREILRSGFGICVKDTPADKPTVVEVGLELLEDWLHRSRRRFHP